MTAFALVGGMSDSEVTFLQPVPQRQRRGKCERGRVVCVAALMACVALLLTAARSGSLASLDHLMAKCHRVYEQGQLLVLVGIGSSPAPQLPSPAGGQHAASYADTLPHVLASGTEHRLRAQRSSAAVNSSEPRMHIGMVATNLGNRMEELKAAMNSLLFTRTCPMHFHFATDNATWQEYSAFMAAQHSSELESFASSFVDAENASSLVDLTVTAFRNPICLLKITPERLFPELDVPVTMLDFDVLHLGDICDLQRKAQRQRWQEEGVLFASAQESCMIEPRRHYNQNAEGFVSVTASKATEHAPFNAGVVWFNVPKLRTFDWTEKWQRVLREDLGNYALYPEQQIMDGMARAHGGAIWRPLSMAWNLQINLLCGFDAVKYEVEHHRALVAAGRDETAIHVLHGNNNRFSYDTCFSSLWYLFSDLDMYGVSRRVEPRKIAAWNKLKVQAVTDTVSYLADACHY